MSDINVDTLVIGAGAVGLSVASALAAQGMEVIALESESSIGLHTSGRNSEVIHSGIYYPRDSLKAKFCVSGKQKLYQFLEKHNIEYRECGKLVVATHEQQRKALTQIQQQAFYNGVTDTELLEPAEIKEREPELSALAALWSPSTGIFNSQQFLLALQAETEKYGGLICTNHKVIGGTLGNSTHHQLLVKHNTEFCINAKHVINCGGLMATQVLQSIQNYPSAFIPNIRYAKGNYFTLQAPSPFNTLVYPLPQNGGLGVHMTLDLAGQARFGPDVEWLDNFDPNKLDYSVDEKRKPDFYKAIKQYWPAVTDFELLPAYSGIRPKFHMPESSADFVIETIPSSGKAQWINILGIESPGLTSCLSLADAVCRIMTNNRS